MAKMIKSISFKEKETDMWLHLEKQLNAAYYIKNLILEDMKKNEKVDIESKVDETNKFIIQDNDFNFDL